VLTAGGLAAGCGYRTGFHLSEGHDTVGVEVFGNDSLVRDLERELHEQTTRAVVSYVHAPLSAPANADLVLRGKITDYRRRGGTQTTQNRLIETGVRISVRAELWDPRTGEVVAGPITRSATVGYTLEVPELEPPARTRAIRNVADRIVLELFSKSPPPPESS
jgi:hypothetical protein